MKAVLGVLFSIFIGVGAFGSEKVSAKVDVPSQIISSYLKIQASLAADSTEGIKTEAQNIETFSQKLSDSKQAQAIKSTSQELSSTTDIEKTREAFKKLSKHVVPLTKNSGSPDVEVAYCPMAGAKWVQAKGPIKNPYFGKKMEGCGEKTKN